MEIIFQTSCPRFSCHNHVSPDLVVVGHWVPTCYAAMIAEPSPGRGDRDLVGGPPPRYSAGDGRYHRDRPFLLLIFPHHASEWCSLTALIGSGGGRHSRHHGVFFFLCTSSSPRIRRVQASLAPPPGLDGWMAYVRRSRVPISKGHLSSRWSGRVGSKRHRRHSAARKLKPEQPWHPTGPTLGVPSPV